MLINHNVLCLSISDSGYPNRQHAPNFELPVQKIACHIFFLQKIIVYILHIRSKIFFPAIIEMI